jgi:hypothetical protein
VQIGLLGAEVSERVGFSPDHHRLAGVLTESWTGSSLISQMRSEGIVLVTSWYAQTLSPTSTPQLGYIELCGVVCGMITVVFLYSKQTEQRCKQATYFPIEETDVAYCWSNRFIITFNIFIEMPTLCWNIIEQSRWWCLVTFASHYIPAIILKPDYVTWQGIVTSLHQKPHNNVFSYRGCLLRWETRTCTFTSHSRHMAFTKLN